MNHQMSTMLTAERLRELLHYDPETGLFTRKTTTSSRASAGGVVGLRPTKKGYWSVCVEGRRYLSHQLAWFWMTGQWPDPECDHRDTDPSNNRWVNLREATRSQQCANQRRRSDNSSGSKASLGASKPASGDLSSRSGAEDMTWDDPTALQKGISLTS